MRHVRAQQFQAALKERGCVAAYVHTGQQLRARYGIALGPGAYLRLCGDLAALLPDLDAQGCSPGRVEVIFRVEGAPVRFVFEPESSTVITALPLNDTAPEGNAPSGRTGIYLTPGGQRRKARGEKRRPREPKYPHRWEDDL